MNPRRTLELVDGDYSVMTELADTLLREADDPFRVGHEVASQLAAHGRSQRTSGAVNALRAWLGEVDKQLEAEFAGLL